MKETMLKMCHFDVVGTRNGFEAYTVANEAFKYQEKFLKKITRKWHRIGFRNKA
jgi:hypothetical protein